MYVGKTLFAQLMDFLPRKTFHRIVDRYAADQRVRTLSCAEQLRVLAFAQIGYRESRFLTDPTTLPARTICALYKVRWQVEPFFKWIKQHLRIKRFYGTSENAVKTQMTRVWLYKVIGQFIFLKNAYWVQYHETHN